MIHFDIPGCPVPWAASKISKFGARDPKAKEKINITWHIKLQMQKMKVNFPLKGPIGLVAHFGMQIPHSFKGKRREAALKGELHHTGKPDTTNMCKLYEDMLQRAGALENDSNVVSTHLFKYYSEKPHVVLELEEVKYKPRDICH